MMPKMPSTSPLFATLALLVLSGGLGLNCSLGERTPNLPGTVPEFTAPIVDAGVLYAAGVNVVERIIWGSEDGGHVLR